MMAQKKRNKIPLIMHHLLKNVVDFELLWMCITVIRNHRPKGMHERLNTKIKVRKKTIKMIKFNLLCLSQLVSYLNQLLESWRASHCGQQCVKICDCTSRSHCSILSACCTYFRQSLLSLLALMLIVVFTRDGGGDGSDSGSDKISNCDGMTI